MPLIVFDNGLRNHTPWYDIFPAQQVQPTQRTTTIKAVEESPESEKSHIEERQKEQLDQSYQTIQREQERRPLILAADVMQQPVITIQQTESQRRAWSLFQQHPIHHLPIVDSDGKLAAMISDRDLLLAASRYSQGNDKAPGEPVSTIAKPRILSASTDTPIRQIAEALFMHRIGALPVINSEQIPIGIVTRSDLIGAMYKDAPLELWS